MTQIHFKIYNYCFKKKNFIIFNWI